ncbi:MATE family efflux transporter [Cuneatibacter caecimuris]|uniref:Probable multidrug resistance protein NorM n=1 Tax=Cuneatibacter caecimuris TaxID=1796618 RepID=A0A4Q7PNP0_9FIRM|nr:MATE family efflux transporter [Cuneatibacter caecimuris]RZT00703.1 putative MATE family efflux protein [Cuneatibacter caecimuris]
MAIQGKDMTKGHSGRMILRFALPLMLGNIFQQVYTLVDTAVVGQVVGVNALAALGSADWFNWMSLGLCSGLTQGFAILMAQYYGAKNENSLKHTMMVSLVLSVISALAVTAVFLASARPVLTLMGTREEILEDALLYVYIMFSGIIIVMIYNWLSSVLRAIGDSATPLLAMGVASVCNIVLDLLFVAGFGWGIAGAAAATLIAQVVSCVYCFLRIRKIPILQAKRQHLRGEPQMVKRLFGLAAPMAVQNVIIAVGGMILQSIVNTFGVIFVAGFTATNKLYGLLEIAAVSFGFAVCTYTGQNLGAGKYDRIKTGVRQGFGMAALTSVLIGAAMLVFGQHIVSIFVEKGNADADQVITYAYHYLTVMGSFLPVLYCLHIYRSALQGMGNTIIPLASGVLELVMRISAALILPGFMGEYGIYMAEVAAWAGAAVLLYVFYKRNIKKLFVR